MRFVPVKSIQHRIFNRFTASFVLEPLSLSILCRWRKATNRAMLCLIGNLLKLIWWVVTGHFRSQASLTWGDSSGISRQKF